MISKKEISLIPKSFEVVGDILIFSDFPKELKKREKELGEHLIKKFKNINVVAKKIKKYSGVHRTPKLKILAGENRKETVHRENGVLIKVNPEKCYFSEKLGSERLRISKLARKNESILVMFSGVAPYPLTISKNSSAKEIYGIEKNKLAYKYAEENVKLNKINNIRLYKGDVKKILPKLKKKFDRIIMPHPTGSQKYFNLALKYLKPKGKIHLYLFEREENFLNLEKKYKKYKPILEKCGSPSPGKFRVCLDLKK